MAIIIIFTSGADRPIHLGRDPPMNECASVQLTCQQCDPFPTQRFMAREDTTFVVEIGPSANPRGYTGITGMSTLCVSTLQPHIQAIFKLFNVAKLKEEPATLKK